jgi:DNA-binding NarL/FixJ family response regulator
MSESLITTPHVLVAGLEPWLAAAVKLWLTRGEEMRVKVLDSVPTRRVQLPKSLTDVSVVVIPRQHLGSQVYELMNASVFPGVPIIVTSDERIRPPRSKAPETQVFPFHLHSKSFESLPHLIRELHGVSQKRRLLWSEGRKQLDEPTDELSEKELQVLSLIARGYSNWAIAKELKVSEKSVEAKLTSIYVKLRLQTDTKQMNPRVVAALHFYGLNSGVRARRG